MLDRNLKPALAPVAARVISALPWRWRASARRRRLVCLATCAPGFAAVATLPLHRNLWILLGGTFAVVVVAAVRALGEPIVSTGGADE